MIQQATKRMFHTVLSGSWVTATSRSVTAVKISCLVTISRMLVSISSITVEPGSSLRAVATAAPSRAVFPRALPPCATRVNDATKNLVIRTIILH